VPALGIHAQGQPADADGDREYRAGEAFYWAPGHAPEALEDCEYVDFSPTRELSKVVEHIQGGG
jgi:hypothetical protein